jgi:acyl carrier protein
VSDPILDPVRDIFQDLFQVPREAVTLDASQSTLDSWDSLQHLNVILALEESFGLSFVPEEMERMTSVAAIQAVILAKQAQPEGAGVHTL